jgi:monofunctional biosynthetic peptidoglycan transglycosylase
MRPLLRWLGWCLAALLVLQVYFLMRIATLAVVAPQSTAFERSEAWRLATNSKAFAWRQQWVDYADISNHLKRAVIASEDDGFTNHDGVDWVALEKAWEKNSKAEQRAAAKKPVVSNPKSTTNARPPKVIGGSTITQQLAKNLLLSGERTLLRKGQEFILTLALETLLSKERILEIYLNHVEWGEGVFGAEAAAQHYFRKPAQKLSAYESARLAVMLPRPKYFEKLPNSPYLSNRTGVILERMGGAQLP